LPVAILIAVLLAAFIIAVLAFVPLRPVNFSQSNSVPIVSDVDTVNFNFDADVANINIFPTNLQNELARVDVAATGNAGLFGSTTQPVEVTFSNVTSGSTQTVTSRISRTEAWPFSFNLKVTANIYIDSSAALNLTAKTSVGRISMNVDTPFVLQGLSLHTTTGSIEANLTNHAVITRDISISTTTGSIQFSWNDAQISDNMSIDLSSTTGSVKANVVQNRQLGGDIHLNAAATTGSINLGMNISNDNGAQITSQTSLGSISTDVQNFNGNKSPIYSSNYPAGNNLLVRLQTTVGSIHITAAYQGNTQLSVQEQVRDSVMTYIRNNHVETARFMPNQSWSGGRVNRNLVGAELYIYISSDWNVTMTYPVVPNPIYSVTADYSSPSLGIPYRIIWEGNWQKATITETSYTFAQ